MIGPSQIVAVAVLSGSPTLPTQACARWDIPCRLEHLNDLGEAAGSVVGRFSAVSSGSSSGGTIAQLSGSSIGYATLTAAVPST